MQVEAAIMFPGNCSKLRERTAELRQKIAEENTSYNVPRDGKE